jgi:FAD/FMN-containing dehydrogenase
MRAFEEAPTFAPMASIVEPRVSGTVSRRGERSYEEARRGSVWNARKPDRHPELIVTARSDEDVVSAVRFARSRGLKVAMRSGGHSWFGASVRDEGLLLDLSQLAALSLDGDSRSAAAQPSVRGRQLAAALAHHDLAFPVGHCASVALGGYLLAGGLGWNFGAWGPACFSVDAVEVVTADGELVNADARRNRELYWLARGSGAGFPGVVTRYHLSLFPLPQVISTSTYVYAFDQLGEIGQWAADARASLPPWVELILLLPSTPDGRERVVVVSAIAFADSPDDAAGALSALETCPARSRALLVEANQPSSFNTLFQVLGAHFPERHRYQADTMSSNAPLAQLLERVRPHLANAPSPKSFALAVPFPPPRATGPPPETAFSPRGASSALLSYAVWEHEQDDDTNVFWSKALVADLEPLASGFYIGETDLLASPDRARRSFAEPNWLRINELRIAFDPDGLFHSYPHPETQ